ncbi:MAG: DUF1549 and DUF1553 domain-containing protein, partial [Verrucomicrobiota bacterium]
MNRLNAPSLILLAIWMIFPDGSALAGFSEEDRNYWAWKKPFDHPVPETAESVDHPVDRFIRARLEARDLSPAPPANPADLVRRLTFDLHGLPASPEMIDRFAKRPDQENWLALIDAALASPRYGERWARHWLDLVRYADSDGYKADVFRPNAWRYRDYVISSFNRNKPFDRFLREQLAGDELFPQEADALVATGYLRQWPYEDNQIDVARQWKAILTDITNITGEVFLGLSMGCARCHDHKYDPILQKDYFRLQAFFAGIVPTDDDQLNPPDQRRAYNQANRIWATHTEDVRQRMATFLTPLKKMLALKVEKQFPEYLQEIYYRDPSTHSPYERQMMHMAKKQISKRGGTLKMEGKVKQAWEALEEELSQFDHLKPAPLPASPGVVEIGVISPPTYLGESRDQPIEPGFLSLIQKAPAEISPPPGKKNSSGRRAALARWITSDRNPLTARVMVNRLWQQHFGRGLVATPNDFGLQGSPPTHPELLDWLTIRFVESGWDLKALHRLILSSETYRQSALRKTDALHAERDPGNRLLWKMETRRLDAEQLRDAMLATSGELDLTSSGPGVNGQRPRRSIFVNNIRNQPDSFLDTFDAADHFNSCARRNTTTTPIQSLTLLNDAWVLKRARAFHSGIPTSLGDNAFVKHIYQKA